MNTFPVIVVELLASGGVMSGVWFMMDVVADTLWEESDDGEE